MSIGTGVSFKGDDNDKNKKELLLELKSLRAKIARQQDIIDRYEGAPDSATPKPLLDLEEHKRMENALRESEERFSALADASMAGIIVYQGEDMLYLNQAMADIEGYPLEERRRMKYWETVHPDFQDAVRGRSMARQRGEAVPSKNEIKIVKKDGEERWVVTSAGAFTYNGKPAVLLVIQDITALKQAELALKKSQYILAKAQQIAHVGNWAWNLDSGQMKWSDEGFRIFGYEPGEVQPTFKWVVSRVHPDDRKILSDFAEKIVRDRKRCSVDYRIVRPDGAICYVNSVADKIVVRAGKPERAYGINQDVTERKKAEEALRAAKTETELYVDLMGHDINNMNQITMGYLELAHNIMEYERKLEPDNLHLLDRAIDSLNNSSRLIDNVRKLQREKMGMYKPEILDVGIILEELVTHFREVPNREVNIYYSREEGCLIRANLLLKDVFINLIGNSIKHSTGPLTINIRAGLITLNGRRYCRVCVDDDGPGIPDNLKRTLFDRLNLDSTRARGKGFGLCLIKMLVDDYNGMFSVEDRVTGDHKQGCRFVVTLPVCD
jgi:PAS domain S-box-containing protein